MNWSALMALGLGTLRLTPDAFWAMTPRELAAALTPFTATPAMNRDSLTALTERFPDEATHARF